jgi:hypothetical protein
MLAIAEAAALGYPSIEHTLLQALHFQSIKATLHLAAWTTLRANLKLLMIKQVADAPHTL